MVMATGASGAGALATLTTSLVTAWSREVVPDAPEEAATASAPAQRRALERLRQMRLLSGSLAELTSVADIVNLLATRVASEAGAVTSVIYLMDPDQEDVLRLAEARGLTGNSLDPGLLCRDGGAMIARAVRRRQLMVETVTDTDNQAATVLACPLLLRDEPVGAFAYGFRGHWPLDGANLEFLMTAAALAALALDRTAATEKAREAERVSNQLTTLVGRMFGQPAGTPA
jgi:GAF domain-containing protein